MEPDSLEDRMSNIEATIGDLAQVIYALKDVLTTIERPTCPPYCAHGVEDDEEDELSLSDRVKDIKKCIGDFTLIFDGLEDAIDDDRRPTCPPYCARETGA